MRHTLFAALILSLLSAMTAGASASDLGGMNVVFNEPASGLVMMVMSALVVSTAIIVLAYRRNRR